MNPSRVYVGVDLSAIRHNVTSAMKKLGPNVKIMVVIKTDAYGHGAVSVARTLADIGVYAFAVATVEEAVELRENGIDNPILILGYVFPDDLETLLKYDIISTVFSLENARTLSNLALTLAGSSTKEPNLQRKAKVHIKIDTGMGRIGFLPNEASVKDIQEIFTLPGIEVEGIFTHLASADEADKTFAKNQEAIFSHFIQKLESIGMYFKVKHISNSAGIIDLTTDSFDRNFAYDMVRSGIMTYGLYPSEDVLKQNLELKPALSLVSHIAFVKEVEAGFAVSYGSTYVTTEKTKIATIPVGYGDGYPRALSGKGRVIINGEYAPIIGRVCMDQFMVDVTNIPNVKQGDQVILVGLCGDKEITVEEVAGLAGSFNYEFVCGINKRVPRVYKD